MVLETTKRFLEPFFQFPFYFQPTLLTDVPVNNWSARFKSHTLIIVARISYFIYNGKDMRQGFW